MAQHIPQIAQHEAHRPNTRSEISPMAHTHSPVAQHIAHMAQHSAQWLNAGSDCSPIAPQIAEWLTTQPKWLGTTPNGPTL